MEPKSAPKHTTAGFFSDAKCFQKFRKHLRKSGSLRIWVAGSTNGASVYSIAILLLEEIALDRAKIQIFGTDCRPSAVERARSAIFSQSELSDVSKARLKRFFIESDQGYQVQKFVRDLCVFVRHDLGKDPPFSNLDLVRCCELPDHKGLAGFAYALKPGGILCLNGEPMPDAPPAFALIDGNPGIWRRRRTPRLADPLAAARSWNEELIALNDELHYRSQEMTLLMDDLSNLLLGVDTPVLVLDADFRIRRFTPSAAKAFRLSYEHIGRAFSEVVHSLSDTDWMSLLSDVKRQQTHVECEVSSREGHAYLLHLRPFRANDHGVEGVLVVMFDVEARKRAFERAHDSRVVAQEAENFSESVLNSLTANVAVVNSMGEITAVNAAWLHFAQRNGAHYPYGTGVGSNYLEVCRRAAAGDSGAQQAIEGIESVLSGQAAAFDLEYPCHSQNEKRWYRMTVSPLVGKTSGAVISHTDISDRKKAEEALQASESTIRSLLSSAPQSVIAVRDDETIVFVNGQVESMFGYQAQELIGKGLELLVPPATRSKHSAHHKSYFTNMQSRPMGIGLDLEAIRKDGTTFPVEIGLSAIQTAQAKLAIAFVSDITERRRLQQSAAAHAAQVQALAASLLTAQEEERRRVSRELHDQICQQLASLAIDMGSLAADQTLSGEAQTRLKELQARVVKSSGEARHLAYQLHSSVLEDLGLVASLNDLAQKFSRETNVSVKMTHDPLPANLSREIGSCIYRVVQECLQNIRKHARATQVQVSLTVRDGAICLLVMDNGVGFDRETAKGQGGLGLIGMEERVRLVHGKLSIAADPGSGTQIALQIPCPPL